MLQTYFYLYIKFLIKSILASENGWIYGWNVAGFIGAVLVLVIILAR